MNPVPATATLNFTQSSTVESDNGLNRSRIQAVGSAIRARGDDCGSYRIEDLAARHRQRSVSVCELECPNWPVYVAAKPARSFHLVCERRRTPHHWIRQFPGSQQGCYSPIAGLRAVMNSSKVCLENGFSCAEFLVSLLLVVGLFQSVVNELLQCATG